MKKRMLALVLAGVLSCSSGVAVLAADDTSNGTAMETTELPQGTTETEIPDVSEGEEEKTDVAEDADVAETPEVPETPETPDAAEEEDGADEAVAEEPPADYTGWWEADGQTYYYVDGEKITNQIYEIEDAWYMFDWDGWLLKDQEHGFWITPSTYRTYRADEEGKLIKGWYTDYKGKSYYYSEEEYYKFEYTIFEYDGNRYFVDEFGVLAVSQTVYYDGVVYEADENGVLTEGEQAQNGWFFANGNWFYFKDGEPVKDQIITDKGKDYYFNERGEMATGIFQYWDAAIEDYVWLLAEADGHIVKAQNSWYYFDHDWYYFKADGNLAAEEFITVSGEQYYFNPRRTMVTGFFQLYDSESDTFVWYAAAANGAIQQKVTKADWVKLDSKWYYFYKDNGDLTLASNEIVKINGKEYYFDWSGVMQTGKIYYDGREYFADASGAIVKGGWFADHGKWYYTAEDGTLYINCVATIEDKKYVFNHEGEMQIGYASVYESGEHHGYITDASGVVIQKEGWKYHNLEWYYISADGELLVEQWIDEYYYVTYDGAMAIGTCYIDDEVYYFDASGRCVENLNGDYKGWKLVDGYWYYHDENGKPYTGWVNGTYYIEDGKMLTEQLVEDNGAMYYVRYDGKYINGWYKKTTAYGDFSQWLYADKNGKLVEDGWQTIENQRYYFQGGCAAKGSVEIDGKTEFFDENCVYISGKKTGWKFINGYWYYFYPDGTLLKGKDSEKIGGTTFYFNEYDGSLRCDTIMHDWESDKLYYLDANGYKTSFTGWKAVHGSWYYADRDGKAVNGIQVIDGAYYTFWYGRMQVGVCDVPEWGGKYFFGASGRWQPVQNGWVSDGYNWYYLVDGQPISEGIHTINGVTYAFGYNGAMNSGHYFEFLFSEGGTLIHNGWYQSPYNGRWSYADASGRWVYGQRTIGGVEYWFDENGILIK